MRLWPLSRESLPKQFIRFLDHQSLLQKTALGNRNYCSELVLVCSYEHAELAKKQLEECVVVPNRFILEPIPKNTSAAICFAILSLDPEEIVLIAPSDHLIDFNSEYAKAIEQAKQFALRDQIAIFGISPTSPETGYGYIEGLPDNTVKHFHEKPTFEVAQQYLREGNFYWNSGMICAKAGVLLKAIAEHASYVLQPAEHAFQSSATIDGIPEMYRIPKEEMAKIPAISIDYALLEKMNQLKFVVGNFSWSDIGSFDSLFMQLPKDQKGNAISAKNFVSVDSKNNLVIGGERMISAIDLEDLVIVDTPDALLISKLGSTQKVRAIVQQLRDTSSASLT